MTDDSDPFGPFKQMLGQFEQSNSSGSIPGVGWPLSPIMAGGSDVAEMSPEDQMKRAVKQLYSVQEALSGNAGGGAWQEYMEAFGVDASAFGPEQFSAAATRTYRIWFFSLTQVLVESYSLRLIQDELVTEDHARSTQTQEWLWGLPQADREQLLMRCTDVPDDLVEGMQTIRRKRDELLYSFGGWETLDLDESLDDMQRTLEVLTALDDRVSDGSPFTFVPETEHAESTATNDTEGSDEQDTETSEGTAGEADAVDSDRDS